MRISPRLAPLVLAIAFPAAALQTRAAPAAAAKDPAPAAAAKDPAAATNSKDAPAHPEAPAAPLPLAPPLALTALPSTTAPAPGALEAVTLAGADLPAIQTPSSPDAWGGIQKEGAPELSQRVASYDLHATLDPVAHTVEGSETLHWKNRSAVPIKTIYFHLYLNGFEGPHSTWMTEKANNGQFRSGVETKKGEWGWIDVKEIRQGAAAATLSFVHPDNGPETDRSVLRADLPEAIAPGATAELKIQFHDQLPRVIARTGYFGSYHLVGQWFPKIGVLELPGERGATSPRWNVHEFHLNSEFYADFGNYDLEVTVPKGFTVAATGERIGQPRETAAGVVSNFHQDDIHDAVFCAWDKFEAPLQGTYQGPGSPTVSVEVFFNSENAPAAATSMQATLDSLKYFSDTLGPYPYRHVTVIVPPYNAGESGGMEYETFFTSEGFNGMLAGLVRGVVIHEFGHGYFMGLLASNEFEEPFLDEGMNEFWDVRMSEGESMALSTPLDKLGFHIPSFDYWTYERTGRGQNRFLADPLINSSWNRYSNSTYNSIYPRTVLVFHDLEAQLGGDTLARGMKLYYARWHHRHPSAADLREALLDAASAPDDKALIRHWFDTQVYSTVQVEDTVTVVDSDEVTPEAGTVLKDGVRSEVTEEEVKKQIAETREAFAKAHEGDSEKNPDGTTKKFHPGPYPFHSVVKAQRRGMQVAQTLLVKFEDGTSQTIQWPPGEAWHRWVFEGPSRIESAQLDPEGKVLLDLNKLDDGRTREANKKPARRWTLELATWMQLAFALVGGL